MSFGTGIASAAALPAGMESADPWQLLSKVYTAVQHVDWPAPERDLGTPAPVLRTMLTYCYAAGTLSAQDIEAACVHDPVVRYICAKDYPSWQAIREFRRRNLPWISAALQSLFLGLNGGLLVQARGEADRRIARAIQADSIALDF